MIDVSPSNPRRRPGKHEPDGPFFQGFYLLPLSLQNLELEFGRLVLLLSLCPRGVIPDAAYPLKPLLVSSRESF